MSAVSPLLFRLAAAEYSAEGAGSSFTLATDLPGGSIVARETVQLPATNGERRVVSPIALNGTTKGNIFNVTVNAGSNLIVYRIGLYIRRMGRTPSDWQWHWISVVPTGDAWETIRVPVPPTSQEWIPMRVPVPPTPEEWAAIHAPVPPTAEDWSAMRVPVPPTPEEWTTWDGIPKNPNDAHTHEFPMDGTK